MNLDEHIHNLESEEQYVLQKRAVIEEDCRPGSLWLFYDRALTCIHALKEWYKLKLQDTTNRTDRQNINSYEEILKRKLDGYTPALGDIIRVNTFAKRILVYRV